MGAPYEDRIQETTTSTGTGTITLAGAVSGYQTFSSGFVVGDAVGYAIVGGAEWEVGIGTLASSSMISRDQVLGSSNAGALVSFSAGTKNVWCNLAADAIADMGMTIAIKNNWLMQ